MPALAAAPVVGLALFYLWPLATLLVRVVQPGSVSDALRAPGLGRVLWFTLWQAVASTVLTMAAGCAPAYLLARFRFRGRGALLAIVTVPFMLPTVVVGAAFLALLPDSWHGTARAVIVAHVFFNIAVVVRLVGAMWAVLPTDLTAAARTLGATPTQVLRFVVVPLLRPALWAAATVVFLFTFTSFGAVTLLGGSANPTLEVEIARRATQLGDVDGAAVLSLLQLLVLGVVVWWSSRWQRRASVHLTGGGGARRVPRARHERRFVVIAGMLTAVLMVVPMGVLVSRSFRLGGAWSLNAWRTLGSSEVRPGVSLGIDPLGSLFTSLRFAVVAALISVAIGGLGALGASPAPRHRPPLDVSPVLAPRKSAGTIGLGMLITFDTAPFDWRASWWLIPLGHALVATPFVVRALLPVLRSIPPDQRAAAATLGAPPLRAWLAIDVRHIARPLAAGAGLAAAISLGEFGATTFLTRAGRETMPIAIARLLGRAGEIPRAQGFALAAILLVTCALIVGAASGTGRTEGGVHARGQ